jgi:hypothetical protein
MSDVTLETRAFDKARMGMICSLSMLAPVAAAIGLALGGVVSPASASCGAAMCSVNTNWNSQIPLSEPGTRVDLRFEYIDQDQPRSGTRNVRIGQIPRHHDEVETINRNAVLTIDHNFNETWGLAMTVPLLNRDHEHIHNHHGGKILETWDFTNIGDMRFLGRYQLQGNHPSNTYGLLAGLKIPTGDYLIHNAAGALAERTLQPGTGTTDGMFGAFWHDTLPIPDSGWFTQLLTQVPFYKADEFRPGYQVQLDLGYIWEPRMDLAVTLQLNTVRKGRDSGLEAEPEDSGSWNVSVAPGVSYAIRDNVNLYSFVQVPIYRQNNGVTLSANWSALVGVSTRF